MAAHRHDGAESGEEAESDEGAQLDAELVFGEASGAHTDVRDTPAEVDAASRTLRRIAITYFVVFLMLVAAFPVLTMTLDWWSESRLLGDLSPGFITASVGLYVVFAIIGIAAATLSSSVESRMLGHQRDQQDRR